MHCATSYAKDGFWLYLTQIASCSPWIFWMFLNSVFHFMWVAVLIMCQLYQVQLYLDEIGWKGGDTVWCFSGISADHVFVDCRSRLLESPQTSGWTLADTSTLRLRPRPSRAPSSKSCSCFHIIWRGAPQGSVVVPLPFSFKQLPAACWLFCSILS